MSFFDNLWGIIQNLFANISSAVLVGTAQLLHSIEQNGGAVLVSAAAAAVAAAETQGGSGSDKFEAAKAAVISTLTSQGIPVVTNAVHGAIEAAVAALNTPATVA